MKPSRPELRTTPMLKSPQEAWNECHKAHDELIEWQDQRIKGLQESLDIYVRKSIDRGNKIKHLEDSIEELVDVLSNILKSPMTVVGEPAQDRVLEAHIMQSKIRKAEKVISKHSKDKGE